MRREVGHTAAIEDHGARIERIGAGDNVDQGRLAGAILAEKYMDLAPPNIKVYVIKGDNAGKALGDARHGEQRLIFSSRAASIMLLRLGHHAPSR